MSAVFLLFARLVLRPLWREPLRTALTILAVALGVAVVIAIDLAGDAAAGSFHSSVEALSGKSDLVVTATGGVDEKLLAKLVQLPYAFEFTPRIEDFTSINGKGEALPFLGLDLIAYHGAQQFNKNPAQAARQFVAADPIWVGRRLNLPSGDDVGLLINDKLHEFTVAGVLRPRGGDIGEENAIVADIGLAQQVTGKTGKLDSIDVVIPPGHSVDYWQKLLTEQLPRSVTVAPQGSRTSENRKMLAAFRWNVHILSYIALLVGAFLIYNTISISVVRRRAEIGVMRALGATRTMILDVFLAEALFLGVCGSLLGLGIGRMMATGAVRLMASTVESLYVSSEPAPIQFTVSALVTGLGLGIAIALGAAAAPAMEAGYVPPVEAMARGRQEYVTAIRSRRTLFWALLMMAAAAAFSRLPPIDHRPLFAYLAALLLVAGTAAAIPNMVALFARASNRALEVLLGVEALLAMRGLRASLGRTSVLTGALATAVAMTASVGIMVGSFRETVSLWMDDQLKADFYLRPAGSPTADRHPTMPVAIADAIDKLPGVAAVDRFRAYPISYEGLPATLAGGDTSSIRNSGAPRFFTGENRETILEKAAYRRLRDRE